MRAFLASFYKDLKLILSSAGVLAVLLPLLLLPALALGMGDLGRAGLVSAFPIAVRDRDATVVSRSLITQLRDVGLFSEVRVLEEGETDAEAIGRGAVAVATIPEDFFYEVYKMADCPVEVTLNSATPLQSSLFKSVFESIMGIIRANHASTLGTYSFVYGELTPEVVSQMRQEAGNQLVLDALGRQTVFTALPEPEDLTGALMRRLSACVLGVLAILFALSSAETVPEELGLGVLPRFRSAGLGVWPFILSKLLSAALLSLPGAVAAAVISGAGVLFTLGVWMVLLAAAFAMMTATALAAPTVSGAQRWGNLIVLVSLALGGTLWPLRLLPGPLRALGRLTLPGCALLALEARAAGLGVFEAARFLLPAVLTLAAGLCASPLALARRRSRRGSTAGDTSAPESGDGKRLGMAGRLFGLTAFRVRQVSGGYGALAAFLLAAAVSGLAASSLYGPGAGTLRLGAEDLDGTEESRALLEALAGREGVELKYLDPGRGRTALLTGEIEGVVTVGEGYGRALADGEDTPLEYTPAPGAVSGDGAREILAGTAMARLRRTQAPGRAAELLGRELEDGEISVLEEEIDRAEGTLPELYHIGWSAGSGPADPFAPGPMSFAALASLLTVLTASAVLGSAEARCASRRMRSLRRGRALDGLSELLALTVLAAAASGTVLAVCAIAPGAPMPGAFRAVMTAAGASLLFAALSALLASLGADCRVDALAPMTAVLLCLIGGCFVDFTGLGGALAGAALISPPGLAARAFSEGGWFLAALWVEAAGFSALALWRKAG